MSPDPSHYLVVGALLFGLGAIGFLTRRNLILMMLSSELMLHGVSVNLTAFSQYHGQHDGQALTIFVLTIAACEAGLSLAIILALYQRTRSLDIRLWTTLGEEELMPPMADSASREIEPPAAPLPKLVPAGRRPVIGADGHVVTPVLSNSQVSGKGASV